MGKKKKQKKTEKKIKDKKSNRLDQEAPDKKQSKVKTEEKHSSKKEKAFSEISDAEAIRIFRAVGDGTRMQILSILKKEELCAAELLENVPVVQSTLSHHMKVLMNAGLVKGRRQDQHIYYSVCGERLQEAAEYLMLYNNSEGVPRFKRAER